MKKRNTCFAFAVIFLVTKINAQATFTIVPSLCAGSTTSVSVNTGTLSASIYTWAALPVGPVFSSSSSQTTNITFPFAGTYTVAVGILGGSGYSYTMNTIVINPVPVLAVSSTSTAICPGQFAVLTASGAVSYTWSSPGSLNVFGASMIAFPLSSTEYTVIGGNGSCTTSATQSITVNPNPAVSIVPASTSVCPGFTQTLTAFGAGSYTWMGTNITAPVFQQSINVGPGTYTVKGTLGTCVDSAYTVIGLSPPLVLTVTQSSPTTCIISNFPKFSKPVHLTASGASSYVWLPLSTTYSLGPMIDVRPAATTCYTVTGSTAVCSGSAVVCVTVTPQFTAAITPSAPVICLGEAVALSVVNIGTPAAGPSSAFTYSWTEAPNAPPISLSSYFDPTVSATPQNSTTYTAQVMDALQCVSEPALVTVTVEACTGIRKTAAKVQGFGIYPNPVKDKLSIHATGVSSATIEVMDAIGNIVLKESRNFGAETPAQNFSVSTIPAGMYVVRISAESGPVSVLRMIKQ